MLVKGATGANELTVIIAINNLQSLDVPYLQKSFDGSSLAKQEALCLWTNKHVGCVFLADTGAH